MTVQKAFPLRAAGLSSTLTGFPGGMLPATVLREAGLAQNPPAGHDRVVSDTKPPS